MTRDLKDLKRHLQRASVLHACCFDQHLGIRYTSNFQKNNLSTKFRP